MRTTLQVGQVNTCPMPLPIQNGLKQGDVLSSLLFNQSPPTPFSV